MRRHLLDTSIWEPGVRMSSTKSQHLWDKVASVVRIATLGSQTSWPISTYLIVYLYVRAIYFLYYVGGLIVLHWSADLSIARTQYWGQELSWKVFIFTVYIEEMNNESKSVKGGGSLCCFITNAWSCYIVIVLYWFNSSILCMIELIVKDMSAASGLVSRNYKGNR